MQSRVAPHRPRLSEHLPVQLRALIIACWDQKPAQRPDMAQAMQDPGRVHVQRVCTLFA